ncbi:MAG: AEC family transporter [Clostridia bacterium]|nr:AEC family transporter [Clostridia bacterium]
MSGAVGVVLTIFILMGVGMLLTHIGWIGDGASSFLSKFVVKVALTATVIQNMFGKFTAESLKSMAAGLVLPFAAIAIVMCLGILIAKRLHMPQNRFGAFVCTFTFSNSVFIGLPVCNALFGEDSATYTLIYYIANTVMFWSAGYALMRRDGGVQKEERSFLSIPAYLLAKDKNDERYVPAKNALFFLSKTVPLPLLAMILSVILILLHVSLPGFIMNTTKYLGNTVTPLSLIYIGCCLMRMIRSGQLRWQKGYSWVIAGKFVLLPGIVIALIQLFSLIPAMNNVLVDQLKCTLIMESAMPSMTQTTIVESSCGGDSEYTAGATALTTLLSFAVIPLYTVIINAIV